MPTKEEDSAFLETWLEKAQADLAETLRNSPNPRPDAWSAGIVSAIMSSKATKEVARHSRELVHLTWALVGLTVVLAALTGALIWATVT